VFLGWLPAILLSWFPKVYEYFFVIGKLHLFLCAIFYFTFSIAIAYIFSKEDIRVLMAKSIEIQPVNSGSSIAAEVR
jgi:hypothetical protein